MPGMQAIKSGPFKACARVLARLGFHLFGSLGRRFSSPFFHPGPAKLHTLRGRSGAAEVEASNRSRLRCSGDFAVDLFLRHSRARQWLCRRDLSPASRSRGRFRHWASFKGSTRPIWFRHAQLGPQQPRPVGLIAGRTVADSTAASIPTPHRRDGKLKDHTYRVLPGRNATPKIR